LTFEVREGIVKHSRDYDAKEFPELAEYLLDQRPPLEAQLIDFVDEIAYNTADVDDGYEARLLSVSMIRGGVPLFAELYGEVDRKHPQGRQKLKFNHALKNMLDRLASDLIESTRAEVEAAGVQSAEDVRRLARRLAGFRPAVSTENDALKKFLHDRLYNHPAIVMDRERSVQALGELFEYYLDHPEAMPPYYADLAGREPRHRVICDYIAGMTDHFLLRQHMELIGASPASSVR
jgi:dGTPase